MFKKVIIAIFLCLLLMALPATLHLKKSHPLIASLIKTTKELKITDTTKVCL
ncbi:Uncharacterised protein [Providencia rettgeri]|nr:Uncharacterised protein [Providencia rettgeri]